MYVKPWLDVPDKDGERQFTWRSDADVINPNTEGALVFGPDPKAVVSPVPHCWYRKLSACHDYNRFSSTLYAITMELSEVRERQLTDTAEELENTDTERLTARRILAATSYENRALHDAALPPACVAYSMSIHRDISLQAATERVVASLEPFGTDRLTTQYNRIEAIGPIGYVKECDTQVPPTENVTVRIHGTPLSEE